MEILEEDEIEDFDDDSYTLTDDGEELLELHKKLKMIPKSRKYGPQGWKTIKRQIEGIKVRKRKKDDDDLIIKY